MDLYTILILADVSEYIQYQPITKTLNIVYDLIHIDIDSVFAHRHHII